MKFKVCHHLDHCNHERHIILDDDSDNDALMIMMNHHEDTNNNDVDRKKVVQQVIEGDDLIRHSSLELSSSFHDDCNRNRISSCGSSDDDDSDDSSSGGSSCSSSSAVSYTNSNGSFGKYTDDDIYCYPLDSIENWIDIDISSTCDDDDDDNISETLYCSSSSGSSWFDDSDCYSILLLEHNHNHKHKELAKEFNNRKIKNRTTMNKNLSITKCEDSPVILEYHHNREYKSLAKKHQQQHDIVMKKPWRTTTSSRMAVDENNVNTTSCSVAVKVVDDHDADARIRSESKNMILDRTKQRHHRTVTFDSNIYVQEYNITVGAYSSVNDTCPLQLTWNHTPIQIRPFNDGEKQQRQTQNHNKAIDNLTESSCTQVVVLPHRMNLKERRQRIATLNDITIHDVYMLEQQMILWQIQDAIHNNHQIMIHNLNFQDNNNYNSSDSTSYKDVAWHKNKNNSRHKNNNTNNSNNTNNNTSMKKNNNQKDFATKIHIGHDTKLKLKNNNLHTNACQPVSSHSCN